MLDDSADARWWRRDDDAGEDVSDVNAHKKVIPVITRIRRNQAYRKRADLLHASLYGSLPFQSMAQSSMARTTPGGSSSLSLNVCKNMTRAVVSKIAARSRPKVSYVTEDGDYEKQHNAEQLERGVDGVFYRQRTAKRSRIIFRDSVIFGTGFAHVYADHKIREVVVAREMPTDIVVDDGEALYGEPRSLYRLKYYDKGVLAEEYPEHRAAIEKENLSVDDVEVGYDSTAQQILVREAFHLPSGKGAKDGRHTLCTEGATLVDEPYRRARFPFPKIVWDDAIVGYFGTGLIEELSGVQNEINKLLREIQKGHHLIKGHYLVENGSKVVVQHIQNDLATIVKYSGTMPQYVAPTIISPEVYQHLWQLYAKAYEISGISQLAAQSQKPAGLDSGAALREYNDQQTERFLEVGQNFEDWTLEVGSHVAECAKELAADGAYEVRSLGDDGFDTVDWADLDDPDGYEMRAHPTSTLPGTPSGKIQYAQDMLKLGFYTPDELAEVISMPDTAAITRRKLAPIKTTERAIARMVLHGEYEAPEPFQRNLEQAKFFAADAYLVYREKRVPEARLELIRRYIVACDDLLAKAKAGSAPPSPPIPPGPPPGAPMPGPPPGAPPPPMQNAA